MTAPLLTVQDLADRLRCSRDWAYRICERGEIGVTRVGRSVRITEEALADYIAARTAAPRKSRKGAAA